MTHLEQWVQTNLKREEHLKRDEKRLDGLRLAAKSLEVAAEFDNRGHHQTAMTVRATVLSLAIRHGFKV